MLCAQLHQLGKTIFLLKNKKYPQNNLAKITRIMTRDKINRHAAVRKLIANIYVMGNRQNKELKWRSVEVSGVEGRVNVN
jgi:hypothetical protein